MFIGYSYAFKALRPLRFQSVTMSTFIGPSYALRFETEMNRIARSVGLQTASFTAPSNAIPTLNMGSRGVTDARGDASLRS